MGLGTRYDGGLNCTNCFYMGGVGECVGKNKNISMLNTWSELDWDLGLGVKSYQRKELHGWSAGFLGKANKALDNLYGVVEPEIGLEL